MFYLYNTLTKKKEEFVPLETGKVGMYVCGPTVYDYAHIGNIKSYITSDLVRRHLEHLGYEVRMIKNITDVGHLTRDEMSQGDTGEDKIEMKAKKEHKTPEEIARFYEDYFKDTEEKMNILPAQYFPRATSHIPHIIKMIKRLIENRHAYESNGNVFYDVSSFSHYGELSGNTPEKLKTGARIEEEHPDKKNQWDFALWLRAPKDHIMRWKSPWSEGYPGWHIECSAMGTEYLGPQFDIHTGGEDHIFPHHEAEIAQSEGTYNTHPTVQYWIHTRHMMVEGKKMSKSKGGFLKLEDIEKKGYSAMDLRLTLLSAHYRSQMNFTWDALKQGKKNVSRIQEFIHKLQIISKDENADQKENSQLLDNSKKFEEKFWTALNDDLNCPQALSHLYEFITIVNSEIAKNTLSQNDAQKFLTLWERINHILGLLISEASADIPQEVQNLAHQREKARQDKDFKVSDKLRDEIQKLGFSLEDTSQGPKIKKLP